MRGGWPFIGIGFLNLGSKPSVISIGIGGKPGGQTALGRNPREQDANGVRERQPDASKSVRSLSLELIVGPGREA